MNTLSTNLLRAALAFGLSFALWTFVSFSQNPEELVRFDDMALQVVGLDPALVLVDTNGLPNPTLPSIDITLRTDRVQRNDLRPVDVRPVLDLSSLGPGDHIVPVNVQPTRNINMSVPNGGVEPAVVAIRIEPQIQLNVPIDLEITGNLPFSFERGDPTIRNTETGEIFNVVTVTGPQSRIERVVAARGVANVEQLRVSYDTLVQLAPIDERAEPVEGVRVVPTAVRVLIPINSVVGLRLVPVVPVVTGRPASGYVVASVEVEPALIALTGSTGPLNAVDALATDPIDLTGISTTLERDVAIKFPPGTSAQAGQPTQVQVTVRLNPVERPFQVQLPAQVNVIGGGAGLLISVAPSVVSVDLTGPSAALNALAQQVLRADVDVSDLGPGVYTLSATVILPSNVQLVGEPPDVTVTIRPPPAPPTAVVEPTTTEQPTSLPPPQPIQPTPTATVPTAEPNPEPTPEPSPEPTPEPVPSPEATPSP